MYIFQDFTNISLLKIIWGILIGNTYRAIFLYRISSWCYNHHMKLLGVVAWSLNIALHSCDISPKAKIGSGLKIYHSVGIVIGEVTIGRNVSIFQNVTIASIKNGLKEQCIGDNTILYSGCCILERIGTNVIIGANAVVTNIIPSESTAIGVPAIWVKNTIDKTEV